MTKQEIDVYNGRNGFKIRDYAPKAISGDTDSGRMVGERYAKAMISGYLVKCFKIIGLKEDKFPERATAKTFVDYIYRKHGWATPEEIEKAFLYAVEIDEKQPDKNKRILEHYQGIGIQLISQVMNLYRGHAEAHEMEIKKKIKWFESSLSSWVEAREKDHEAVSSAYIRTLEEYADGAETFTYVVLFPAFYDWLDFLGLVPLTTEEKNLIAYKVKAARVDNFKPAAMDRPRIENYFHPQSIKDACKRKAMFEMFEKWGDNPPTEFIEKNCYIGPNAFEQLNEIIEKRNRLQNG